ncbi:hypothetical protein KKF86_04110 [bacterium]|nr:hypothetical protein [bacterium]
MAESGDFELFGAPAAKEQDEKNDEKFHDEMKRAQQQLTQLQKEEGQVRVQDNNLAQIIVEFLGKDGNTDLFLLISRAVAQNIPSELILAVISLVDKRAFEEVEGLLQAPEGQRAETTALAIPESRSFQSLNLDQKKEVDGWIKRINEVASKKPHRTLESLIIKKRSDNPADNGKLIHEIAPSIIQLSAFILRNYLTEQKVSFEFDQLHEFMQSVFVNIVRNLGELVQGQKQINE